MIVKLTYVKQNVGAFNQFLLVGAPRTLKIWETIMKCVPHLIKIIQAMNNELLNLD